MKKIIQILSLIAVASGLSACISVNENAIENSKQISVMSQQAINTCGAGNVDKVATSSFTCKSGK